MQGLTYAQAEKKILDILKVRQAMNKKGGRKFISLSKNAKLAIQNQK